MNQVCAFRQAARIGAYSPADARFMSCGPVYQRLLSWTPCLGGLNSSRLGVQIVEETLPALEQLRQEGLVRHIGITGLPLKIYRSVLDRCGAGGD